MLGHQVAAKQAQARSVICQHGTVINNDVEEFVAREPEEIELDALLGMKYQAVMRNK